MLIWTLAIILFGLIAALGYLQGAVRLGVSLFGLFLGAFLAFPLAPIFNPFMGWFGVKSVIWMWVLPPMMAFLVIFFAFIGVAFVVHRKVELYFKYRADDLSRLRWDRLNSRLGVCMGLLMGGVWFYLLGIVIYSAGNLTVQLTADEPNSTTLRLLNQARKDLRDTGLEPSVAAFDPMPKTYYELADVLGLLYHNPILFSRLSLYPPFLNFQDKAEFGEIATDSEYSNLLLTKADVTEIIKHPRTQAILQSPDILKEIVQQDLKDLKTYLETGESPKFEEENILGKWELDRSATIAMERKKNPNMKSSEMLRLKKTMAEHMPDATLIATPDKQVKVKTVQTEQMKQAAEAIAAATAQARAVQNEGPRGMSPEMAARYRRAPSESAEAPAAPAATNAGPAQLIVDADGMWERESDTQYRLTGQTAAGQSSLNAVAEEDRLVVKTPGLTLVFYKVE